MEALASGPRVTAATLTAVSLVFAAAAGARPAHLEWNAPSGCADTAQLKAAVERLLDEPLSEGDEFRAQATVARGSTGVGDLDGDGYDDLVISTKNATAGVFTGTINLFYGAPQRFHGAFAPADSDADFDWYSSFVTLAAGDLNGDGHLDILVGDNSANGGDGWLALIPGTSERRTGTYAVSESDVILAGQTRGSALDVLGTGVSTGDINGDGLADVVVGAVTDYGGDLDGGRVFLILGAKQHP